MSALMPEDDANVYHGAVFDDGRRWCVICKVPKFVCKPTDSNYWRDKSCDRCQTIWPEYEAEFSQVMMDNFDPDEVFLGYIH